MSTTQTVLDLDQVCVNTMRTLAIDAIQQANSGHPGTPMGMSPTVYCLWQRLLRFDPEDPIWMNRDRFVLSAGHASTLLYTILHLARVKAVDPEYEILGRPSVTLDDLKSFRQFGSRCAGHPEYRWDRALPRVWAWPLPKSGSPRVTTSQILNCSAIAFTHSAAMAA